MRLAVAMFAAPLVQASADTAAAAAAVIPPPYNLIASAAAGALILWGGTRLRVRPKP